MASMLQTCIICKKTNDEESGLKKYKSQDALRGAAEKRRCLSHDKFQTATNDILSTDSSTDLYYHTQCNSRYSAVKRRTEELTSPQSTSPSSSKSTRSKSDLPQSNTKGVLGHSCVFCSHKRKRASLNSFENLSKVETLEASGLLVNAAKGNPELSISQRVLGLGSEDLVAIEAHYHNSCRVKFLQDTNNKEDSRPSNTNRSKHEQAFDLFTPYIEDEIIKKQKLKYVSNLMDLYKKQYNEIWGDDDDLDNYLSQNFIRKVKVKLGDRLVTGKESKKAGNFVYPKGMTFEDATLLLKIFNAHEQDIQNAALSLRAEILNMDKTKRPAKTSIHTLKESSAEIPPLTKLFYQTLISGLAPHQSEVGQRKTLSLASDAVFATSRGNLRPWKNTSLGLGVSSLLGSKSAVTILNRLGHSVSYDECKRLESEIAYTCSSGDLETPAGLLLQSILATGTAWDNYDVNVETLDGKNSLHVTVGIAYQNDVQHPSIEPRWHHLWETY